MTIATPRYSDTGLRDRIVFPKDVLWESFMIIGARLNLAYFMDITGAEENDVCGEDRFDMEKTIKAHVRRQYAGQTGDLINVDEHVRRFTVTPNRIKGNALAGKAIRMADNIENRQFRLVGDQKDLVGYLTVNANMQFWLYGERGSRICIPKGDNE